MSRRFTIYRAAFLLCSISMVGMTAPASAQEAAIGEAAHQGGVEDIIVTARKRVETAQNIPVAVTAYTGEQLLRNDLTSLEKVAAMTPQFQVGKAASGSGAQLTLRGIGSNSSSIGIEQSVAVIVDGVYYGNGRVINEGFFDLAQLELLKGPQALFFGKNATAGAVSITTANPTDNFEGMSRAGFEFNSQQVYAEQILSGPITETLGARLAVRASRMFEGFTRNLATPAHYNTRDIVTGVLTPRVAPPAPYESGKEKEFMGRLTLQWKPIDDLTMTLKGSYAKTTNNNPTWNNIVFSCPGGYSQLQPTVRCQRDWTVYNNMPPREIAEALAPDARNFGATYRNVTTTAMVEYGPGPITLNFVGNYQNARSTFVNDGDYQQAAVNQIFVSDVSKFRAFSGEIRAVSDYDGPLNFLAGMLFQDSRRFVLQTTVNGNTEDASRPPEFRFAGQQKTSYTDGKTISPFGQVILNAIPKVEITAGVRYTYETKDSAFVHPSALQANFRVNQPVLSDQKFTNWSPEATVTWRPQDNLTIYGAYKTAYKSGGFSNASSYLITGLPSDMSFGPERGKGFEAGLKGRMFDRQLRFDITAFNYLYKDLQIDFFNGQTLQFITTNAGSARTKGIELQADFAPRAVDGLTLRGSLNYTHARYVNFISPCYTGQTIAAGCNTTAFRGLGQDLSGKSTAVAPDWTGSFGVSYDRPIGNGLEIGLSTDARYSSSYIGSGFGNPQTLQPKYVSLDALLRLGQEDGAWQVALIGKNLTNQFWISGAFDSPSTGSGTGTATARVANQRGFANTPRTVQFQLTFKY